MSAKKKKTTLLFHVTGVTLLPFLDQDLLLSELKKHYADLTKEELFRNRRSCDLLAVHTTHPLHAWRDTSCTTVGALLCGKGGGGSLFYSPPSDFRTSVRSGQAVKEGACAGKRCGSQPV